MANREERGQRIQPDMKLDKNFFLKIYGYSITTPDFAEKALSSLELAAGCSLARQHYTTITAEYQYKRDQSMREAASWYCEELRKKWSYEEKRGEKAVAGSRKVGYKFRGFPENW